MDAVEKAIAAIEAKGREDAVRLAADKAREVTLTADLTFRGDVLKVEVRGIPPFAAVRSYGPLTGTPGWTVLGRKYTFDGLEHTYTKAWDRNGERFGGLPLLKAHEAHTLAAKLNAAADIPSSLQHHEAA